MKAMKYSFVAAAALTLVGCSTTPQQPIALSGTALSTPNTRVGVALSAIPTVDTYFPGASCLLCIGVASAAHKTLTGYVQKLPTDDLVQWKEDLASVLRKKGLSVTVVPEAIQLDALPDFATKGENIARKDFSSFKQKYQLDKLVVIEVKTVGVERSYQAYIPTSEPKGFVRGAGYLVNLNTNGFEWYQPIDSLKSTVGTWDEPPKFPGVTNAYFQAIEAAKDTLAGSLSK